MTSLQNTIAELTQDFAARLAEKLKGMSVAELIEMTRAAPVERRPAPVPAPAAPTVQYKPGRLRQTEADVADLSGKIIALLKDAPQGMRAEQLRAAMSIDKKELVRPLAAAMEARAVVKRGEKRATTYHYKKPSKP